MDGKICVIVPIHNVEKYLNSCIDSIVKQTYSNLEIILVDDGSTDACPQLCDQWAQKDGRIRVIHKTMGGVSETRNAALDICTSEWITFVDSDDRIHRQALEKMMQAAKREEVTFVMASYRRVTDEETLEEKQIDALSYEVIGSQEALKSLYTGKKHRTVAWAKLYHRSLWEKNRFPVGRKHEDEAVMHRLMFQAGKIVCSADEIYFYRTRPGSIMADPDRIRNADIFKALWERQEFFEQHQLDELAAINVNFILDRLMDRAAAQKRNRISQMCMRECFDRLKPYHREITLRNHVKHLIYMISPMLYNRFVQCWKRYDEIRRGTS